MSTRPAFAPFENEADVVEIGQLTFENRLDRISISGDVELTADSRGLEAARRLHALLGDVVARLEAKNVAKDLPEQLLAPVVKTVKNPFA